MEIDFKKIPLTVVVCCCLTYTGEGRPYRAQQTQDDRPETAAPPPAPADDNATTSATGEEGYEGEQEEENNFTVYDNGTETPTLTNRHIDAAKWQQLTKDPAFRYDTSEPKPAKPIAAPKGLLKFLSAMLGFFTSPAGRILIMVIVALILIAIVVRIVQLNGNILFSRKDKKLGHVTDELSETYIPEDWNEAIERAAAAGNYRLAVRHMYRHLLHSLQSSGRLQYQLAKTNYQYAAELSGTELYSPFVHLTRQYERAWYGGIGVSKALFEQYYTDMDNLKKTAGIDE
ncbi:MAG: DUF4129 domain-containing protein [Edaphocola sp.]